MASRSYKVRDIQLFHSEPSYQRFFLCFNFTYTVKVRQVPWKSLTDLSFGKH